MSLIKTLYGPVQEKIIEKLSKVKMLAFDVDGVFSDGHIYMGNQGEELKSFNTLDGYGVKAMLALGIEVAVITGRNSQIVENRMSALGVSLIVQGEEDKASAMKKLMAHLNIKRDQIASVGDDMPDLGMFTHSGLAISVPNGHPYVQNQADYVTYRAGGSGAVREVCDLVLMSRNKLNTLYGSSV